MIVVVLLQYDVAVPMEGAIMLKGPRLDHSMTRKAEMHGLLPTNPPTKVSLKLSCLPVAASHTLAAPTMLASFA